MPIIPTDGESIEEPFWSILEAFDPDYIYCYQPDGKDVEDYDSAWFSEYVDRYVNQVTGDNETLSPEERAQYERQVRHTRFDELRVSEELISEIKNRLSPFHREGRIVRRVKGREGAIGHPLTNASDVASPDDCQDTVFHDLSALSLEMQLMAASVMGRSSEVLRDELSDMDVEIEEKLIGPDEFDTLIRHAWEHGERGEELLHALTNIHCSPAYRSSIRRYEEPTVLVCGSTVQDYCLYQSLFSLKAHVCWLPDSMQAGNETGDLGAEEQAMMRLRWKLSNQICAADGLLTHRSGDEVRLITVSRGHDELEDIGKHIESDIMIPDSGEEFAKNLNISNRIDDLLQYRREVFESGNVDHRSSMQFERGVSVDHVDTPKPRQYDAVLQAGHRWVTDIEVENYHLPTIATFGPSTVDIHWYDTDYARVTQRGFSYFCPHHTNLGGQTLDQILARPTIHLQAPLDLFETLFGRAGYHIRPSDKGDFQYQAQLRVGGFEALYELLCRSEIRDLLDRYVDTDESTPGGGVVHLGGIGRCYLSFDGVEEITEDRDTTVDLIDELVEMGVLRRGVILQCQYCRNSDWYDIGDLAQHFNCRRCRHEQRIQHAHWKQPARGPDWYFELDEIIYQFYVHNTDVTVLALGALKEDATSFLHIPELEISQDEDLGNPEAEIDICAIVDGNIVIGEASVSGNKTRDDFNTYISLADDIDADTIVFVALADEWSPDLIEYATEQCGQAGKEAKFLAGRDLLGGRGL